MPFPCNRWSYLYAILRSLLLESLGPLMDLLFLHKLWCFLSQKIQGENWNPIMLESTVLGDSRILINPKIKGGNGGSYSFLVYLICRRVAGFEGNVNKWVFLALFLSSLAAILLFKGSSLINTTSLWWSISDGDIIIAYLVIQWFSSLMAIRNHLKGSSR